MSFPNQPKITRYGADPLTDFELGNKQYVDNNSGAGAGIFVGKTVDQVINNVNTLVNDDQLLIPLEANSSYWWLLNCYYLSQADSDFQLALTIPSGAVGNFDLLGDLNGVPYNYATTITISASAILQYAGLLWGNVITDSTAGNVQFQWSQVAAKVSDTTVFEGSTFVAWKLN